jgi:hypothetical protein
MVLKTTTIVNRLMEDASRQVLAQFTRVQTQEDALAEHSLCRQQEKQTLGEYYKKFLLLKS